MKKLSGFIMIATIALMVHQTSAMEVGNVQSVQATSVGQINASATQMQLSTEDTKEMEGMNEGQKRTFMEKKKKQFKMQKENMMDAKREMKDGVKHNRNEARGNRQNFREDHRTEIDSIKASLSEEQKKELIALKDSFMSQMDDLREELKGSSSDEKARIYQEMRDLADEHYKKVKDILGDDVDALALLEKRKGVFNMNQELREDSRKLRMEYKGAKRSRVDAFRKNFIERLGKRLDNIPTEKLEKVADKIDAMIARYEANENISDAKKEAMLSALVALKEIIEEKMEGDNSQDEVLGVVNDLLAE